MQSTLKGQDVWTIKFNPEPRDGKPMLKIQRAVFQGTITPSWAKGEKRASVRYYQAATGKPGNMEWAIDPAKVYLTEADATKAANARIDAKIAELNAARLI